MLHSSERNGFLIQEKENDNLFPFYVYHPEFPSKLIDAFETLEDAQGFCDEERPEYWEHDLRVDG